MENNNNIAVVPKSNIENNNNVKMKDRIVEILREEFQRKCFLFDCESWRFITLQWSQGEPPGEGDAARSRWNPPLNTLLHATFYRGFMMMYTIAWLVADAAVNVDPYYITFLTHWGQIVMVLYFIFSFFIVYLELANRVVSKQSTGSEDPTENSTERDNSLRWYHVITWVLFNIYIPVSYIITVSYWVGTTFDLIAPTKSAPSVNFHVHVVNSILATIEISVVNLPVRILHFYCPMAFGAVYLFFTLIVHWAGDLSAIYAVLDWMSGPDMAAGYALGILFIAVPIFHVMTTWAFTQIRQWVYDNRVKLKAHCCRKTSDRYCFEHSNVENNGSTGVPNPAFPDVINPATDDVNNPATDNVNNPPCAVDNNPASFDGNHTVVEINETYDVTNPPSDDVNNPHRAVDNNPATVDGNHTVAEINEAYDVNHMNEKEDTQI